MQHEAIGLPELASALKSRYGAIYERAMAGEFGPLARNRGRWEITEPPHDITALVERAREEAAARRAKRSTEAA